MLALSVVLLFSTTGPDAEGNDAGATGVGPDDVGIVVGAFGAGGSTASTNTEDEVGNHAGDACVGCSLSTTCPVGIVIVVGASGAAGSLATGTEDICIFGGASVGGSLATSSAMEMLWARSSFLAGQHATLRNKEIAFCTEACLAQADAISRCASFR